MSFLRKLDKNFEFVCLAGLLIVMTVLSFANVVMRYFFRNPIFWSDEICCYCLALSAFICLPCSIRYKTAIRVDTFVTLLPKFLQRVLLDGENIIMPSSKTLLHRQLSILFHENGITPNVLCSTSQPDIIGQLTGEGLASGFASETVARKICAPSCRVMEFDEHIRRKIYYVTLKELNDYPLTRAFKNFLENKFNHVI